jgi:hypothetical protein
MRIVFALVAVISLVGCGNNAAVEFGMNDEAVLDSEFGDIGVKIRRIEFPEGDTYNIVWAGAEYVQIELQNSEFVTITNDYTDVTPGTYSSARVTVDSVVYVQETSDTILIDTVFQFTAQTFAPLVIDEGDELQLVVVIASENWFDSDSVRIIPGRHAFQGATLRVHYSF